jgi:hypothetical protein
MTRFWEMLPPHNVTGACCVQQWTREVGFAFDHDSMDPTIRTRWFRCDRSSAADDCTGRMNSAKESRRSIRVGVISRDERDARQRRRYWNPPVWPGLSCLDAVFTSQHFAPHLHEALVIAVTDAGGSVYTSRGHSAEATSSTLLVFNPAEPALETLLATLGLRRMPGFCANGVADPRLIRAVAGAHHKLTTAIRRSGANSRLRPAEDYFFATPPIPRHRGTSGPNARM